MEASGSADFSDQVRSADRRENHGDKREAAADVRERQTDARERVLDRWEAELAARAAALEVLDEVEEETRELARTRRAHEREQRREAAEARRDDAIERDIQRGQRETRTAASRPSADSSVTEASEPFAPLVTAVRTNPPLQEVLQLILAAGVDTVPDCAAATVALSTQRRLETAASTAPWAVELDAAQLAMGCGPLLMAAGGRIVTTANLSADERWPSLARLSATSGARSVMCFGLVVSGTSGGVLTLYSDVGGRFGAQGARIGDVLAALAALAMGRTFERLSYDAQAEAWQHALASRDVIGQAKGILMGQRSIDANETFNVLRETSQRLNIKLRDVAEHVVVHGCLPDV